ncbi:tetratricopeptide repeat protein [Streptococcus sp. DD13]|uniref:tetratricopeptide repeat protein n=1 Tax=Streptococcus sp. DD13 TaxID=1777881 RepID=UPI000834AB7A|nr:tetratricopeptide repeat protein [Streptococcus sp. DD13]
MNNSEKMILSIQSQDLERAKKYFKRARSQDDPEVLLELAVYLEGIGFFSQAKTLYEQLLPIYPESALQLAQIANDDGNVEEAFAYLEQIGSESPYYLEALLVKADLYQSEGLTDVAREKLLEASRLSEEEIIRFGLAELDMELGFYQEAIEWYVQLNHDELLELTGVSIYQRIGIAYARLGRFEVAIEYLEKSVELEYDDTTLYELAVLLYDQEEYQKANLYFKQLDTLNPEFEGYEYPYAQSLHAEHQVDQAITIAEKGLQKNQYDSLMMLLISQYAYEAHDPEKAERYLLLAKDNAEDLNEVLLRLSNLYLEQERYEDVVALAQEEFENVLTRWNLAKAFRAIEEDDRALTLYKELEDDLKENPEFLQDMALYLKQLGDRKESERLLKAYLQRVPDDMDMQVALEDLQEEY